MNQAVKREAETSTLHHRNHGIAYNVPLARYTRFRVGGTADIAFTPENPDDLAAFLRDLPADVPLTILGLGSNVLIRDGGIRGAVILFSDMRADPIYYQEKIYAPAGLATPKLARFAASLSYKDSAFLSGIPGTVGGALAMNAGCYGEDTWSHVEKVEVLQRNGIPRTRTKDDYEIGYRHVALKNTSDTVLPEIFLGAWFSFTRDETVNAVEEIKTLLAKRAATQPLNVPNAGSVFRNP
ncbi:MAG: FAD-binding protein, partial [Burkholderiales bacterium]|nr:FAD-binding protein [Burkholderiales bacterium]